jgi:CheY-like chemotaxis protein
VSEPLKAGAPVLLVEDTRDDVLFFRRAMLKVGATFPLQVVFDGLDAISYLAGSGRHSDRAQFPFPKILLLDLKLPGAGGLEVLEWIRRASLPRDPIVIVLSSSSEISDVTRAQALGASLYLVKPTGQVTLREMVRGIQTLWSGPEEEAWKQLASFTVAFRC